MAEIFHIDPVEALKCDRFDWELRLAALDIIVEAKEKARKEAERKEVDMAARAEDILINIRTIGATQARDGIDKVQRSVEKLNKSITDEGAAYELNSEAMKKNNDERDRQKDFFDASTKSGNEFNKSQTQRTKGTKRETTALEEYLRKSSNRAKTETKIMNLIEGSNTATKERINLTKSESKVINKVGADYNRTFKIRRNLATLNAKTAKEETRVRNEEERSRKRLLEIGKREEKAATRAAQRAVMDARRTRMRKVSSGFGIGTAITESLPRISPHFLKIFGIVAAVSDLLPIVMTGLNALGAGAIAAVNGLAPLMGMLGALPPAIFALGQAGAVLAMAFGGNMAKALGGDAKALATLGPDAEAFAVSINRLKPAYQMLGNLVRENFFKGMGEEIRAISNKYLPFLNQNLQKTAANMNKAARNFTGWMQSGEGMKTNKGIGRTNAVVAGRFADSAQVMLQTLLMVTNAAGPMIREISSDVLAMSLRLNNWVAGNGKGIGDFFTRSYHLFKDVMGVLGNFGSGFVNIIKDAAPLTAYMADHIRQAGVDFKSWTETNGGGIRGFFEDMKAPLGAIMRLAGAIGQALFNIGQDPQFVAILDRVRTEVVPKLEEFFKSMDGKWIDLFINLIENITNMANSGVFDEMAKLANFIVGIITNVVNFLGDHPMLEKFTIWALGLGAIFGGILTSVLKIGVAIAKFAGAGGGLGGIGAAAGLTGGGAAGGVAATGGAALAGGGAAVAGSAGAGTIVGTTTLAGGAVAGVDAAGNIVPLGGVGTSGKVGKVSPLSTGTGVGHIQPGEGSGKNGKLTARDRATNRSYDKANATRMNGERAPKAARGIKGAGGGGRFSGAGSKALGAAGAAALIIPVAGMVVGDSGSGFSGLSSGGATSAVATGDSNRLFQNDKGGNLVGGWKSWANGGDIAAKVLGGVGKVDSTTSALNYYNQNTKGVAGAVGGAFGKLGGLFGQSSGTDKVAAQFGELDDTLNNMVQSGDTKGAATQFAEIQKQAQRIGMPMDKLVDLFPKYRDYVESTVDPMDKAGHSAQQLADKMALAAGDMVYAGASLNQTDYTSTDTSNAMQGTHDVAGTGSGNIVNTTADSTGSRSTQGGSTRFAGGTVLAGTSYLTGELGPEAVVSRSGMLGMVGLNGPEMFTPSSSAAIIPSSATFGGGNFGNTPGWAQDVWEGAGTASTGSIAQNANNDGGGGNEYHGHVTISGNASQVDVMRIESAVKDALRKAAQDQKERR